MSHVLFGERVFLDWLRDSDFEDLLERERETEYSIVWQELGMRLCDSSPWLICWHILLVLTGTNFVVEANRSQPFQDTPQPLFHLRSSLFWNAQRTTMSSLQPGRTHSFAVVAVLDLE